MPTFRRLGDKHSGNKRVVGKGITGPHGIFIGKRVRED